MIKDFFKDEIEDIRSYGVSFWLKTWTYYPVSDFFTVYYESFRRSLAYARFGWKTIDYDAASMWELLAFKLKRIQLSLLNGPAIHFEVELSALAEAIEICLRLHLEEYELPYEKAHDEKWGEIQWQDSTVKMEGFWALNITRANVTPENSDREYEESIKCHENALTDRNKDMDRLHEIFKNYSSRWWD